MCARLVPEDFVIGRIMANQDKTDVPLRHLMAVVFIHHNGPEFDMLWTFVPLAARGGG